ncbi:Strongly-conserved Zn-finger binding protein (TFIIIA) [Varicellaria rhodocarpa]|nr:Strongly-conserved Zn-finger binding protein (TFIIIA) [Varicellaria rhodocarpa]
MSQPVKRSDKRKYEAQVLQSDRESPETSDTSESQSPFPNSEDNEDDELDDETISTTVPSSSKPASLKSSPCYPSLQKNFHCHYEGCTKSFSKPVRLTDHLRSHANIRPFGCPHTPCTKTFLRNTHLKHHIKSAHTDVRDYACNWDGCDKKYATGTRLRKHQMTHEGREKFKCTADGCGRTFRKHGTLQIHITADHEGKDPFVCGKIGGDDRVCGMGFDTASKLKRHDSRVHVGDKYWCTICNVEGLGADGTAADSPGLGFSTYGALQAHNKAVHPSTCSECGYTCLRPRELTQHMEIQHGGQDVSERRTHPCTVDDCVRSFTRRSNLLVHMRTVHKDEKDFVCGTFDLSTSKIPAGWNTKSACGKAFTTKGNLIEHVRTAHLGLDHNRKAEQQKKKQVRDQENQKKEKNWTREKNVLEIARLTGLAYEVDDRRQIPCLQLGCAHRFIRDYDLNVHLQAKHGLADFEIQRMKSVGGGQDDLGEKIIMTDDDHDILGLMQRDIERDREDAANLSGSFSINEGTDSRTNDEWNQNEKEMRELMDQEIIRDGQGHENELAIDPALK